MAWFPIMLKCWMSQTRRFPNIEQLRLTSCDWSSNSNIATLRSKLTEIDHDNGLSLFALRIASQIASVDRPSIRTKPGFVLKYPRSMDAILLYAIAYKASYCDTTMLDVSVSQSTDIGFVGMLPNSVSESFKGSK